MEKYVGYFTAPLLALIANGVFGSYLARYYSDVLGWSRLGIFTVILPVAAACLVILFNLKLGEWIDNVHTGAGKARPFLLLSAPLMFLAILLLFLTPLTAGKLLKMLIIAVTYCIYYAVAFPCYYTAHSSLVALSTREVNKRGELATLANAALVAANGIVAAILVPLFLQHFMFVTDETGLLDQKRSHENWKWIALGLAVTAFAGIVLEYFYTKERITEENEEIPLAKTEIPVSMHRQACLKEPYWWMVMGFALLFRAGQLMKNSSLSFYVRWMFSGVLGSGRPEYMAGRYMSVLALITGVPAVFGMLFAWPLAKRLGKKRTILWGLILASAGGLLPFLGVHRFSLVCIGVFIKAVGILPAQFITVAVISDVLDHLESIHDFRSDGFTMAVYGAIQAGLPGLCIGLQSGLFSLAGYDASAFYQSPGAERMIAFCYLGFDILMFVLAALFMRRMDVEYHSKEDQEQIREHHRRFFKRSRKERLHRYRLMRERMRERRRIRKQKKE